MNFVIGTVPIPESPTVSTTTRPLASIVARVQCIGELAQRGRDGFAANEGVTTVASFATLELERNVSPVAGGLGARRVGRGAEAEGSWAKPALKFMSPGPGVSSTGVETLIAIMSLCAMVSAWGNRGFENVPSGSITLSSGERTLCGVECSCPRCPLNISC